MDLLLLKSCFFTNLIILCGGEQYQTKYLAKCGDLQGSNTVFRINENVGEYVLYNISNVGNLTFYINQSKGFIDAKLRDDFGIVKLRKPMDYEISRSYKYTLYCQYKYDMNIIVENIVEDKLSFYNSTYKASISKDVPLGTVVLENIRVKYGDANPNDLEVSVSSSNFFLSYKGVATFQLQVQKMLEVGIYKFTITTSMSKFTDKNGSAEISIEVLDDKIKLIVLDCKDEDIFRNLAISFGCLTGILLCAVLLLMYKIHRTKTGFDEPVFQPTINSEDAHTNIEPPKKDAIGTISKL